MKLRACGVQASTFMSELELLNLARSATEHEVTWFAQMLTINFAMIVAIYYFLHTARFSLQLFSFFAYSLGMLVLLGEMLGEANLKLGAVEELRATPAGHLSQPSVHYLSYSTSWVSAVTQVTFNLAVWLLWFGIFYLLFFARQHWRPVQSDAVFPSTLT